MASEVGICNAALQMVKHSKRISDLTQGTKEANACEVVYEELRDALLEMHQWNFAAKRLKLPRLAEAPAFEWDYAYQMPSDYVRIVQVYGNSDGRGRIAYKIEGDTIVSDETDVYVRYVARITDPNKMRPTFRVALSKLIASRLATSLAQSRSAAKALYDEFLSQDLPTAKSADSLQDFEQGLPESDWVAVRYGDREYYEPGEVELP
jgi:hypothetical protein